MPTGRPRSAVLLETAHPELDPAGLISKFLRYEVIRSGGNDLRAKLSGTTKDHLNVLLWYIASYSLRWGRSLSIPLSENQLRFLNDSLPIDSFPPSISVALWNLLSRDRPDLCDVTNPNFEKEAVYWWCFEKTPQLNLEYKLVTPHQIAVLQRIDLKSYDRFPLNTFMRMHIQKNPELQCLNLNSSSGRLAALHYFVLYAHKYPYIGNFLPLYQLEPIFKQDASGARPLDDNISFLLKDASDATDITQRLDRGTNPQFSLPLQQQMEQVERKAPEIFINQKPANEGVAVIGPIEKTSGLGQATRLSYQILEYGLTKSLSALPFNVENPALIGFSTKISYSQSNQANAVNLFHLNAESIPLAFALLNPDIFENSYNIGYFFWELDKMPEAHFLALDLLDEIWVSSEYVRQIYTARTSKPVINVGMAVENLPSDLPGTIISSPSRPFTFLTTFDSFSFVERKNPLAVIRAFESAFGDNDADVALIVKTWNKGRVSDPHQLIVWREIEGAARQDNRIKIIDETFTYGQLIALKNSCNCYVSLHRAEGFGFGMLEAMQLGRPVIATAYSGNMEFCRPENCYLVDYDLVLVGHDEYPAVERGSVWAEPNIRSAAQAMRNVFSNSEEALRKGAYAAKFVEDNFSIKAISQRYQQRLEQIKSL